VSSLVGKCPQCGSSSFYRDIERGIIVCMECGLVIEENIAYTASQTLSLPFRKARKTGRTRRRVKRVVHESFFIETLPYQIIRRIEDGMTRVSGYCRNRRKRVCQAAVYALVLIDDGLSKNRATTEAAGRFLVNRKKLDTLVSTILKEWSANREKYKVHSIEHRASGEGEAHTDTRIP